MGGNAGNTDPNLRIGVTGDRNTLLFTIDEGSMTNHMINDDITLPRCVHPHVVFF